MIHLVAQVKQKACLANLAIGKSHPWLQGQSRIQSRSTSSQYTLQCAEGIQGDRSNILIVQVIEHGALPSKPKEALTTPALMWPLRRLPYKIIPQGCLPVIPHLAR